MRTAIALVVAASLTLASSLGAQQCGGTERWAVKMGADATAAQVDLQNPVTTSIHDLVLLVRPTLPSDDVTRAAPERTVRVVDGRLVKFKRESGKGGDSDFHLVISDATLLSSPGGPGSIPIPHSFIAEIPDANCVGGEHSTVATQSRFATQLGNVRTKFLQQFTTIKSGWNQVGGLPVRLTGVVFFDRQHNQVGRALNGLELHPLLDIVFNPPAILASATGTVLALVNPGFESGAQGWTSSPDVITTSADVAAHAGQGKAWLGGYGTAHTDRLSQQVTLPSAADAISLTFHLHIDTEEDNQAAYDKLFVRVRAADGTLLKRFKTFTNLNAADGFTLQSFDLTPYKGRTIVIELEAREDNGSSTSFVLDDFAIVVTSP